MDILKKLDILTDNSLDIKDNTKYKNGQKTGVPKDLLNRVKKELAKKHKKKPEDFEFYAVFVPGFKNKVFLMFNVELFTDKPPTTISYELDDKDK
jgi:hypothetical protein